MSTLAQPIIENHSNVSDIILCLSTSGLSILHLSFSNEEIDPDLFSALLTAISIAKSQSELSASSEDAGVFSIDNKTATICYGKYLAGIIIGNDRADDVILIRLKQFIEYFESEYEFILRNWHGEQTFFDYEWASQQLLDFLNGRSESAIYQLQSIALHTLQNARHIRLIQLIQRFAPSGNFNFDEACIHISQKLDIPLQFAVDSIMELEKLGLIAPMTRNN